jgi:hypothetical protein
MTQAAADLRERAQRIAQPAGVAGFVLLLVCAYLDRSSVLHSYLFVWWFLLGIPLGSMVVLMVHNLTGGSWGELIRPALEAAMATLPFVLLLSIPLWLGLFDLYTWATPGELAANPLLQAKAWYLNPGFFYLRSAICFGAWLALAHYLHKWSFARAADPESAEAERLRSISSAGLLLYGFTVTIAAVDWIMSLSLQWYSTTFGLLAGVGQALCAFAFAVVCAAWFTRGMRDHLPDAFHDLGNLLLMFVMTWTYLAYTQYLIIWAENLPNEIAWYLPRVETSWRLVAIFLILFHFAVPFLVLLSRRAKRMPRAMGVLAAVLLFAHLVDAFWLVSPACHPAGLTIVWSDVFAVVALGSSWLAALLRRPAKSSSSPRRHAREDEAIKDG